MRCHHHSTSSPSSNSLTYLMTTKAVAECERGSPRQGGTVGTPIRSRGCRPPEVPACCERCHARYGWGWHTLWGTAMRKGNWAINVAASLGWLAFVLVIIGLNGPAIAQGGANCLFQCDSQCYGQQGPYCRPAAWPDAIQIKTLQDPARAPVPALVPSQRRQQQAISMVTHSAGPHRRRRSGRLWPIAIDRPA
jgi:hypothetical protein